MPSASRTIDVNAPAETILSVLCDFERYPEFITDYDKVHLEVEWEDNWRVAFEVRLFRRLLHYTLRFELESEHRLSWRLLEADWLKAHEGVWEIYPRERRTTRLTYSILLETEKVVAAPMVPLLLDASIPRLLRDFKRRAEQMS